MKVVMKHVSGTAKANLERAKLEIAINPKWELDEKVSYLKEWIPAKVRKVFEVISVSA